MALARAIQHRARLAQQSADVILVFLHNVENMQANHLTPATLPSLALPPNRASSPDKRHRPMKKVSDRLKVGSPVCMLC